MAVVDGYSTVAELISKAQMFESDTSLYFLVSAVSFLPDELELEIRRALAADVRMKEKQP